VELTSQPVPIIRRLHLPACVFLIAFGVAKLAELADWSRLHGDAVRLAGAGSVTTGLLIAGKAAELLFTLTAVLALVRRRRIWLLAALAGWALDLAVLSVIAAVSGDHGRLLEHGLSFIAIAGLLVVTYAGAGRPPREALSTAQLLLSRLHRTTDPAPKRTSAPEAPEAPEAPKAPKAPAALPAPSAPAAPVQADVTRQDLPARPAITRQDIALPGHDVTRQDLPVRKPTKDDA
jgi:hypothetical protein